MASTNCRKGIVFEGNVWIGSFVAFWAVYVSDTTPKSEQALWEPATFHHLPLLSGFPHGSPRIAEAVTDLKVAGNKAILQATIKPDSDEPVSGTCGLHRELIVPKQGA